MSRNANYPFVPTDAEELVAEMVSVYEKITDSTVRPASPERRFIQWAAAIVLQERVLANYAANQNIPSRAEGKNLDALAELTHSRARPEAKPAVCTVRFSISEAQSSAVLIPAGTRVTDGGNTQVWTTTQDVYVDIGNTSAEVQVQCQTAGVVGNGWAIGQINTLIDLYDYCDTCTNTTVSDGGADEAADEEFYELMRASMDAYSCAGARGGYIYFAKKVSTEIADVVANSPTPGVVKLYVLMNNGDLATEEIKSAVLAACSADEVRPLTDQVFVEDAEAVPYDVVFTYYLQSGGVQSAADIAAAVQTAVEEYNTWQRAKLGRDINPSYLLGLLMQTGVKRVELTAPVFTVLRDGSDKTEPQAAALGTVRITSGGYEDE